MRVKADYYDSFQKPEVCNAVVKLCRQIIKESGRPLNPQALVAKKLQAIISRHYSPSGSPGHLWQEWERDPQLFIDWVLTQDPDGQARLARIDIQGPYSPENLEIKPRSSSRNNAQKL